MAVEHARWTRAAHVAAVHDESGCTLAALADPTAAVPIRLNESGTLVWQLLDDQPRAAAELAAQLAQVADLPHDDATAALTAYLPALAEHGLAQSWDADA